MSRNLCAGASFIPLRKRYSDQNTDKIDKTETMLPNLSGRGCVALVTGASRGIGKGISLQLGEAGAAVYITGRNDADLESTRKEIADRGGKAYVVKVGNVGSFEISVWHLKIQVLGQKSSFYPKWPGVIVAAECVHLI